MVPPGDGDNQQPQPHTSGNGQSLELTRAERLDPSEDGSEQSQEDGQDEAESRSHFGLSHPVAAARAAWERTWEWIKQHSNFYRVHLLTFTIVPLIASSIFYGVDSRGNSYVNCLTLCTSAMTVTGLNPILMENTSRFQQAIVFFLQIIGNIVAVSIVTIIIRRHFFRKRFEHMVKTDPRARKRARDVEFAHEQEKEKKPWLHPFHFGQSEMQASHHPHGNGLHANSTSPNHSRSGTPVGKANKRKRDRLRVDMIRRVDAPVKVNQMNVGGFLSENGGILPRTSQDSNERHDGLLLQSSTARRNSTDGGVLEKTATRTDSPGEISSQAASPVVQTTPASPKQTRRVSLAALPDASRDREPLENNPMTTIQEGVSRPPSIASSVFASSTSGSESENEEVPPSTGPQHSSSPATEPLRSRRMSDPTNLPSRPRNNADLQREFKRVRTMDPPKRVQLNNAVSSTFPRTQTIEIREPAHPERPRGYSSAIPHVGTNLTGETMRRRAATGSSLGVPLQRTTARRGSIDPLPRTMTRGTTSMNSGFGGFPNPVKVVANAAQKRLLPRVATLDMPRTTTLQSVYSDRGATTDGGLSNIAGGPTRAVSYISFDAVVGRNSRFYSLTSTQRDELGGVEYRALSTLLKIVVGYFVLVQLVPMVVLAPIFQSRHYNWIFRDQDQGTLQGAGGWYVAFNIASGFSNSGLSLLDESMTPFQRSYGYVLWLGFCILAGNTAFPVFLRLTIWTMSKLLRGESRLRETIQFLLDHPRRCFIYLFPSHQTWFLVFMLVALNATDWVCFIVLDIGSSFLDALPPAAKAIDGLFQAFAVRAAGFSIVSLAETAPALQFLYVIMMYLAVFPIALSIRSTNVYEEKSMGLYEDHDQDVNQIEAEYSKSHSIGSYFAHHARKQLAFDIWWLGLALWAICIVERRNIDDPATDHYFNIFTITFEVVSAYGTVGLSLGSPNANYSLCGEFRQVSKLILCLVMLRGRHRGLPVAIDRSILLPSDLEAMHPHPVDQTSTTSSTIYDNEGGEYVPFFGSTSESNTRRKRSKTNSSSGRYTGGNTARRMSSTASGLSRLSGTKASPPTTSPPVIQFAPAPTVPMRRETPTRPTLTGYLSTIYSEQPTPAGTPDLDRQEEQMREEEGKSASTGPESTSSAETSSKDPLVNPAARRGSS